MNYPDIAEDEEEREITSNSSDSSETEFEEEESGEAAGSLSDRSVNDECVSLGMCPQLDVLQNNMRNIRDILRRQASNDRQKEGESWDPLITTRKIRKEMFKHQEESETFKWEDEIYSSTIYQEGLEGLTIITNELEWDKLVKNFERGISRQS